MAYPDLVDVGWLVEVWVQLAGFGAYRGYSKLRSHHFEGCGVRTLKLTFAENGCGVRTLIINVHRKRVYSADMRGLRGLRGFRS